MSRTVVIALDSSSVSARALPFARTIADQWSGRVILVHATDARQQQAQDPLERELAAVVRKMRAEGIQADAELRTLIDEVLQQVSSVGGVARAFVDRAGMGKMRARNSLPASFSRSAGSIRRGC